MFGVSMGFHTYEDELVQTHGLVNNRCFGSRAPPATNSSSSPPLDKVQQGSASLVQGEEEDPQHLPNRYSIRKYPDKDPAQLTRSLGQEFGLGH